MKKLLIGIIFLSLSFLTKAHTLTNQCWSANGTYGISAAYGDGNGKIEVTVYTNSNMNIVVQSTRTFFLNSNGAVNFTVNQPVKTNTRFVYVRWFRKNSNGAYSPVTWNSGQGYSNSYSSVVTNSNQCNVVGIKFNSVKAYRIDSNTFRILFDVAETEGVNYYKIKLSSDGGVTFKEKAILFPDDAPSGKYEITIKL